MTIEYNAETTTPIWACGTFFVGLKLVQVGWNWIPMPSAGPIEPILQEVEHALELGLYYLALMLSLALPDICGALQSNDGRATSNNYKKWFNMNLADKFEIIDADDCYSLRCGVMHQGKLGVHAKGGRFDRILFSAPNTPGYFHQTRMESIGPNRLNAKQFDTRRFCIDVLGSVREWYQNTKDDPNVKGNIENIVRYREEGLAPFFVGIPIIG